MQPKDPSRLSSRTLPSSALCGGLFVLLAGAGSAACLPDFPEDCFSDPSRPECEDSTGNGGGTNTGVAKVLEDLGVMQSSEPRVDGDGNPLPDDYTPLGSRRTINRFSEILFFGAQLEDADLDGMGRMPVLDIDPGQNNTFSWSLLSDPTSASTPWLQDDRNTPRRAVEGDFDGDGQDEVAIAYQISNEPMRLLIMDGGPSYAFGEPIVVDTNTWQQVFLESGDFDGDGSVDLVIGLVGETEAKLVTFLNGEDGLRPDGTSRSLQRPGSLHLSMDSGNLDGDRGLELAVVANNNEGESARYYIYDDANRGFELVASDITAINTGDRVETAVIADIALGDVDGDGLDEVVLGGLDRTGTVRQDEPRYLVQVWDDLDHDLMQLAGLDVSSRAGRLKPTSSGANQTLSFLHVLTADVDGDGAKEIVTNQFLYEDLRQSPGALVPLDLGDGPIEIPLKDLFTEGNSGDDYDFNWRSSDMAAADVTSDKRENIVLYAQRLSTSGEGQELQVWGIDGIDGWKEMLDLETTFANPINNGEEIRPQIILADTEVDNESMALEYSEGSYRYVFTEPVVLAALAAPPCSTQLGQDVGSSCRTAFGQAVSETQERENSWSVTAGVSAGFQTDFPFVGGAEAVLSTRATVEQTTSNAYELRTSVLRETGSLEDSVIFTTVPLDIYTYTVLSHPNPELVGEQIEVRLPREPITVLVETAVYNAALEAEGVRIDDDIFTHVAGDPSTYRSRSEKNAILNRSPGLESDEVDVGQGTGQTVVSITEFNSSTMGTAYDFEASLDVKVTAGPAIAGYSVGGGLGSALRVTRGDETIYQGAVGNLSSEFFPQETYAWGLFAYIYSDPATGQTFEVLDYWVE